MSRIQFKMWMAPIATLQASLAEGECAIAAESRAIFRRPDGQPNAPLVQVGLPALGQGLTTDPATGALIISSASLAQVMNTSSIASILTPQVLAAALTPAAIAAALPLATASSPGMVKPGVGCAVAPDGTLNVTVTGGGGTGGAADTAVKLATARTIALSGDVTGSALFDGSANISIAATLNQAVINAAVQSAQSGLALTEAPHTSDYVLTSADIGKLLSNLGATTSVQFQLPDAGASAFRGVTFEAVKVADQTLSFKAAGGQYIMDSSSGGTLTNSTAGEVLSSVKLRSTNMGGGVYKWAIVQGFGTWTTA